MKIFIFGGSFYPMSCHGHCSRAVLWCVRNMCYCHWSDHSLWNLRGSGSVMMMTPAIVCGIEGTRKSNDGSTPLHWPPCIDPPALDRENHDFLVLSKAFSFKKCYFWCFLGVSKNAIFWSFFWGGSEGGVVLPTMSCPVCLRQVVLQTGILLLCCAQHEVCRETQRCVRHTETD